MNYKTILLDIEGTTTPIDFVHKTLFPFAKERIGEFVRENFDDLKTEIAQLKTEYKKDFSGQIYGRDFQESSPESIANYLEFLIEIDRKSTPLKSLQGKIWQKGYEASELKSEVFEDVPHAFERWTAQGKTVAIYSSGSVLAQELLFKHTNFGDLTPFISAYFDTNTGPKKESQSYENIARKLQNGKSEILFVSDIEEELKAARKAGLDAVLCLREGKTPAKGNHKFQTISSFDSL